MQISIFERISRFHICVHVCRRRDQLTSALFWNHKVDPTVVPIIVLRVKLALSLFFQLLQQNAKTRSVDGVRTGFGGNRLALTVPNSRQFRCMYLDNRSMSRDLNMSAKFAPEHSSYRRVAFGVLKTAGDEKLLTRSQVGHFAAIIGKIEIKRVPHAKLLLELSLGLPNDSITVH